MPKRREPGALTPGTEQIEAFAAGANPTPKAPDPTAPRDFKALRVGLNEYEYQVLEVASRRAGRSKLNFIRHAILKMAEEMESN